MDLFEKYLKKKEHSKWVKRALTDRSFKKEYLSENKIEYKEKTNEDLATYGDAVIKLGYMEILLDKVKQPSKDKQKLESDEFFVTVIAKHYKLLDYIRIDSSDEQIARNYNYRPEDVSKEKNEPNGKDDSEEKNEPKKKKEPKKSNARNPHKYIATAVEAMIGAIYKEEGKKLRPIIKLLKEWIKNKDVWINDD